MEPKQIFHSFHYLRHNARRLEHLSSLGLSVRNKSVLETGAGIGDHSHYFLDRNCKMTITEARESNLEVLRERFPDEQIINLNLEAPPPKSITPHEIVYCYGTLYHLANPIEALSYLASHCTETLLLETCVSFGEAAHVQTVPENQVMASQAFSGTGSRPTRAKLMETLKSLFEFVYIPITQPNHEEFPVDWDNPEAHSAPLSRAIFIASRTEISNPLLTEALISRQTRHN